MNRPTAEHLYHLRNDIPIDRLIEHHLRWPSKRRNGIFRFLCPVCQEYRTATKPTTNLGRCFCCERNFNPIDFVMAAKLCDFLQAVAYLEPFLPKKVAH